MLNKERTLLFILAAIQFTHIMDFMIMMPLGPQLMRIFQIAPSQFALIVSAYTFSAGIFGFAAAFFIDRLDRKKALLTTYIGFVSGTFACALAPTYEILLLARILAGAFGGILGALVLSIVGDAIPAIRRASAMGTIMASFSVASVLGVPAGLYFASISSWHLPFFVIGGLGLLITVLVYLFIPNMTDHIRHTQVKTNPFDVINNIVSDKNQLRALLLMMMLMLGHFSIIPFLSPFMVSNVGFSEHQLTYIYLLGGAVTIFTSPVIGRLADRYGKKKIFSVFIILSLIPILLITHMPAVAVPWVLLVTSFFFITSSGRMIPAQALVVSTVSAQRRGGFMSINSCVSQLSSGTASFFAGLIVYKNTSGQLVNYGWVGVYAAAFSFLCIFIAWGLKPAAMDEIIPVPLEKKTEEPVSLS